ncbi:hypothetical protein OEZ86_013101 [Tetradesmus obliquus]|nr:hypothetical protein OEZ86_013101 [Tetradesmus obliquus]
MGMVKNCLLAVTLLVLLQAASASTVTVSNSSSNSNTTSFLAALEDQAVTQIVLADDYYSIGKSFDPFTPGGGLGPLPVKRNVTVTAAKGPDTLLDLQFVHSAVELCGSCKFIFKGFAVGNERRGPGGAVEFFLGQPGARIVFEDGTRFRPGCTTAAESGAVADATKRSIYFPHPDGKQQWTTKNVTFRGSVYPNQLMLIDHTMDDPRRVQEGRGPMGGVAVSTFNTSRVCRATVDPQCLQQRSSDACVNMLVDEVLAADAAAAAGPAAGRNTAGLAAGAAVAGVVVVGAILGALLWERRRRRQKQQQQLLPLAADPSKGVLAGAGASRSRRGTLDSDDEDSDMHTGVGPKRGPDAPAGGGKGWDLSWTLTTPLVPKDERDAPIELGELLGAGSFGRVFKGTWAGRVVAVKVISHDAESSDVVENEITLMLGFNHPNIVRAFHSLTYVNNSASSKFDCKDSSTTNAISVAATTPRASSFGATPLGRHSSGRALLRAETWIVQEFCDVGTLDSVVSGWEGEDETDARMLERLLLLKDVASGLAVLHANNVVHGDLNARNVLVSSSSMAECGMVAKLADLGLSRAIKQHKTHRTTNTIGTMSHMPPELLRYGRMSTAVDIYAFGISMWEVYTGTPAFKKLHYGQFYELICLRNLRPLVPEGMPSDYRLLMENCWATEPTNRPTADRIIECLRYMIIERQRNLAGSRQGTPGTPLAAAAAAAAAPRRLSGSFHYGGCRRESLDFDVFGGYTAAVAFPPALYTPGGAAFDCAAAVQGGLMELDNDDDSLPADTDAEAAGEGIGGKGAGGTRQLQQQSSFQDTMRWFV